MVPIRRWSLLMFECSSFKIYICLFNLLLFLYVSWYFSEVFIIEHLFLKYLFSFFFFGKDNLRFLKVMIQHVYLYWFLLTRTTKKNKRKFYFFPIFYHFLLSCVLLKIFSSQRKTAKRQLPWIANPLLRSHTSFSFQREIISLEISLKKLGVFYMNLAYTKF